MLNLFTESVLQKNFDTPSLFSIAQHRWVETGNSASCTLYFVRLVVPTIASRPVYAITYKI